MRFAPRPARAASCMAAAIVVSLVSCGRKSGDAASQNSAAAVPVAEVVPAPAPESPPSAPSTPAADGTARAVPAGSAAAAPAAASRVPVREPRPGAPAKRMRTGPVFGLPTENDAIFRGKPEEFYMFVDRYTPTGPVEVWQGGGYGYVRNPRTTTQGEVFTKFHEGVDIAPVKRDRAQEPLDIVHAIGDGTVVYCSPNAASNYGNYVVIEHPCGEDHGSFYSLYAHLRRIDTVVNTPVKRGQPIALMGHTGEGIDRRRSHVHLELCMMLSDHFSDFYARYYKLANPNANFHGHNLIGIDVAGFLLTAHQDPGITPDEFIKATAQPYYKVRVPNKGVELPIAHRYPWLRQPGDPAASWEITYNSAGVPLAIAPDKNACSTPTVSWVKPFPGYHGWNTRNQLGGSGNTATLAAEGIKYQQLVTGDF